MGFLSNSGFISRIKEIFRSSKRSDYLTELEDLLVAMDVGVETAMSIVNKFSKLDFGDNIRAIQDKIKNEIEGILRLIEEPLSLNSKPHVMMFCGVNGNGKTTTIGKLAYKYRKLEKKVALVACDTFRAAAIEQLVAWSERAKCPVITGKHGSDPASVAYRGVDEAIKNNVDVLLIDTAGRLHSNINFMRELAKIRKTIQKQDQSAPHDVILVLDATTGQNAYSQVESFKNMVNISGLIITKLDGSAKGGVVVGLAQKYKINLHAIGIGEGIEDIKDFNAKEFVEALF